MKSIDSSQPHEVLSLETSQAPLGPFVQLKSSPGDLKQLKEALQDLETPSAQDYEALMAMIGAHTQGAGSPNPGNSDTQGGLPSSLADSNASLMALLQRHASQPQDPDLTQQLSHALTDFEQILMGQKAGTSSLPQGRSADQDLQMLQAFLSRLDSSSSAPASVPSELSPDTLGSDILSSFLSSATPAQASVPVAPTAAVPRDELSTMLSTMVDRLLVGDARFQSKGEVQMKLADNVLPQTELKLWRGEGGQLHVEFITQSAEARELLAQKLPLLSARLNEQFANLPHDRPVQVNLNGDQDMPQDGRSRQRYEPPFSEEESLT